MPPLATEGNAPEYNLIIAGDGYAYVSCGAICVEGCESVAPALLVRVDSGGAYDIIDLMGQEAFGGINMITNADQGVLLTWWDIDEGEVRMAITTGTSVNLVDAPQVPGQQMLEPVLQAQDGSFVGTAWVGDYWTPYMVAFDQSGNVCWTVPNEQPQIATADGGVIGQSGVTYDANGNATGQVASRLTVTWTGNTYQLGSVDLVLNPIYFALSFWPFQGATTAHFPVDSIANEAAKKILTPQLWQNFKGSHSAAVFGDPGGGIASQVPYYSLDRAQTKQRRMTNFYDVGNPGVGDLTRKQVTGGKIQSPQKLSDYLGNATAATDNMGEVNQTAVVLKQNFFSAQQADKRFTLMHEVLLHAYGNWWDDPIFGSDFFQQNGLWRPQGDNSTTNITTWMSTDCTCTPNKPGITCPPDTAPW